MEKTLLLGTKNVGTQTVLADGQINIGNVYRRFCKANKCGVPCFSVTSNGITLNHSGIYHVTAVLVGTGATAGLVSVQLAENGELITGAISSETITNATDAKTISLVNVSDDIDATFTSVVLNVTKEV